MRLEDRLHLLRERLEGAPRAIGLIPADALPVMHRVTEDLRRSGMLDRVPRVGERAPAFALESASGQVVSSDALLAKGPVVLSFYRGRW